MIERDLRSADADAVRAGIAVVSQITSADLGRPTPCADWDLATLLTHMTVQHHGFAAAAAGLGADLAHCAPTPLGPDPVARYTEAAEAVIAAFADPDVLDRPFVLPEFRSEQPFPGHLAIGFHLVDYVVHGWDVARAVGVTYAPTDDVLRLTLPIAQAVPDDNSRREPGAPFAPALPVGPGADPLTEILRLLGRDPDWS
jgi:uncharacterized protein (TIGR03086 family)